MDKEEISKRVDDAIKRLDSLGLPSDVPMIAAAAGVSLDEVKMILSEKFAIKL